MPFPSAHAIEAWWCAPDAVLAAAALPDVLPASACALDGRAVVGATGLGVEVPPLGAGVALSVDGAETLVVWADEYGVHVRGDQYVTTVGYLRDLRTYFVTGDGSVGDLDAMARAVHRLTGASVGRVRPLPFGVAVLLDAADAVAAAVPSVPGDVGVLAAHDVLDTYFRLQAAPRESDDLPSLAELRAMAARLRAALPAGGADAASADGLLADAVMLRNHVRDEPDLAPLGADLDVLVGDLRAAQVDSGVYVEWNDVDHDATLAQVEEALARELGDAWTPGLIPWPALPSTGEPTGGAASTAAPPACSDGTRKALYPDRVHWPVDRSVGWYYSNLNRYPVYHHSDYYAAAMRGFDNVTGLTNDCGYGWEPRLGNTPKGYATQRGPDVSRGNCVRYPDTYNVVGWSAFSASPDGALAFACVWRSATRITNADVTMNNTARWNIPEVGQYYGIYCDPERDWDVEGVLTHEFGHVAGLDDVDEAAHGNLTMSAMVNEPCGRDERTLGYGDAIGLAALYGRRS